MNTRHIAALGLIGAAAVLLALAPPAFAYTGQKLAGEAKISIEQARGIALKAHPGKITDEELEREPEAAGFAIPSTSSAAHVTQEVGVDAEDRARPRKHGRRAEPGLSHRTDCTRPPPLARRQAFVSNEGNS